jgi:hypothetical protein
MAISQRAVDKILTNQSNSARKVYDILREDPWTVNRIVQELRNANAGNTPDRKVVSGCLNDLTDAKILKRTGQDMYSRAPVRKDSSKPLKVSEFPPLVPAVLPREIAKGIVAVPTETSTTNTPAKPPVMVAKTHPAKPPVATPLSAAQAVGRSNRTDSEKGSVLRTFGSPVAQATPGEITDPLLKAYALANEVADMADVLARMSVAIRESAIELEKERDKVRVKSEKIEKLTEALRSLQLGD